MSLEAVELPGRRRVDEHGVISGDVIDDVITDDVNVVADDVTPGLCHGAPVRRLHATADVAAVDGHQRTAVAGGRRSRRLGESELLENASLDRFDASLLQHDPLQHAVVDRNRGVHVVDGTSTST